MLLPVGDDHKSKSHEDLRLGRWEFRREEKVEQVFHRRVNSKESSSRSASVQYVRIKLLGRTKHFGPKGKNTTRKTSTNFPSKSFQQEKQDSPT